MIDFEQIMLNIRNRVYRCIGSGSGRLVFDMGNEYVVKVAKNRRGIAQNEAEYRIASLSDNKLLAKVQEVSADFRLLIMEKADTIQNILSVFEYLNVRSKIEFIQLEEIRDILYKHNLLLVDLYRPQNWGRINDRFVIIDYGYTQKVKNKYYSFFNIV